MSVTDHQTAEFTDPAPGTAWLPTIGEAAWNQRFRRDVQRLDEFGLVHLARSGGDCTTPLEDWRQWKQEAAAIEVCK
jgi:hypothetical protein